MEQKLWKIERWLNYGEIIPLAVVVTVGLFFNKWKYANTVVAIFLLILGFCLIVGTQVLPPIRLWKYIGRSKSLIINTVLFMVIYIGAYAYFYYNYVVVKSESSFPIFILLGALVYQRFSPTDKVVEKYMTQHLDMYPEEAERIKEQKRAEMEKAREEAERIAKIEQEEAERKAEIPDFDDFFNIDKKD